MAVLLLLPITQAVRAATTTTETFGYTSTSGLVADSAATGYKMGSIATLTKAGSVTSFRFYARGGSSAQKFVPVIYRTSGGVPTSLVVKGPEVNVAARKAAGWVSAPLPATSLAAGSYVLGLITGPTGMRASVYYRPMEGGAFWNENAYPTPSSSWGTLNKDNVQWAVAVDYTPSVTDPQPTATTTAPPVTTTTAPPATTTTTTTAPPVTTTTTAPPVTTTTTAPPVTTTTAPPAPTTTTTVPAPPPPGGGCPAFPQFPNKSCTGVPAGTSLTTHPGGPITQDNAVISNVRITSRINVFANNVTFRNCLISVGPIAIGVEPGYNGLTLENCTFKSGSIIAPKSGLTMRRVLVDPDVGAYRPDGIVVGFSSVGHNGQNVLIEDSYIGPQWGDGGSDPDHTDAIQMWGFGTISNVVIRHNYIDSTNISSDPTAVKVGACAFLADGSYEAVTFEYNFCTRTNDQGGYFHLRLCSNTPTSGHIIRGNRFGQRGSVTPVDLFRSTPSVWSDNRYTDGTLIPQPNVRT